jgi:single-stranded-DNA-specific exonuclease
MIGLVASKLTDRYGRPAVAIALSEDGPSKGSCRSVSGVDVVGALSACADLLEAFGGHEMAAGLTIARENLEPFRQRFNRECSEQLGPGDLLTPVRRVDAWISLAEADERLYGAIQELRPLGMGNPTPTWGVSHVRVLGRPRVVGRDHLKMNVAAGGSEAEAIAFGMADRALPDGPMDLLCQLQENTFRGRRSLQLNVKDFRPAMGPGVA